MVQDKMESTNGYEIAGDLKTKCKKQLASFCVNWGDK